MSEDVERSEPRDPTGWEREHLIDPPDDAQRFAILEDVDDVAALFRLLDPDDPATLGPGDWATLAQKAVNAAVAFKTERDQWRDRYLSLEEEFHSLSRGGRGMRWG